LRFALRGPRFSLSHSAQRFGAAQRLACYEQKRLRPVFAQRNMHKSRMTAAQLSQFTRFDGRAQNYRTRGCKRLQNFGQLAFTQRSYNRQLMRYTFVLVPNIAGEYGNRGNLSLRAPTSSEKPREFGLIRDDQYIEVLQGNRLPNPVSTWRWLVAP
jgi:hypothetical protein